MTAKFRWTRERTGLLLDMHETGANQTEIGAKLRCSAWTVSAKLRSLGIMREAGGADWFRANNSRATAALKDAGIWYGPRRVRAAPNGGMAHD